MVKYFLDLNRAHWDPPGPLACVVRSKVKSSFALNRRLQRRYLRTDDCYSGTMSFALKPAFSLILPCTPVR